MDVTFTDEQQALRAALADLLGDHSDPRSAFESETGADMGLHDRLVALGALELPSPVEQGILAEECGRTLAATPLLASLLALPALDAAGADDLAAAARAGEAIPVLALDLDAVPEAHLATHVVHVDGDDVRVLPASSCTIEVLPTIDGTRRICRVRGDQGPDHPGAGRAALAAAEFRGAVLLAHELVGIAQATLDLAVGHAREREQFGKAIGSFQAISHQCAESFIALELARSHAYYAAWAVEAGDERAALAASQAKASANDAAVGNAQRCIQVHGGIGFTWEHDAHLYLKRARSSAALLGGTQTHRRKIADLMGA